MKKKILYVSDLDGTLLTKNTELTQFTRDTINNLVKEGMHFTFATARSKNSAFSVTKGLHLNTPLIVYNGAFLLDPVTYKPIYSRYFRKEECTAIIDMMLHYDLYPFVYAYIDGVERVSYMENHLHEGGRYYLNCRKGDPRFRSVSTMEKLYEGDIFYITSIHDEDVLKPVYEQLDPLGLADTLFHQEIYRDEFWLECMPVSVSKAAAIMELKKIGQFDHIISFGDALNDIAMFSISDESYAVENAVPELKEKATGVIAHHDEDAVALWLERHFKKSRG